MKVGSHVRRSIPVVLSMLALTCGGGGSPTAPPLGPAGSPVPAPTPTPTPTPAPVQTLCQRLGFVSTANVPCSSQAPSFQSEVNAAIDQLQQQHPEYFANESGGIRIRNLGAYYVGVIENVNAAGLCAGFDGEELQVKSSNDANEQWDISSASGYVRRSYLATCAPAAFPTPEPPLIPPPAGCSLPSSREVACGEASSTFLGALEASIDQVVQQHPEYFNQGEVKNGNWYKVIQVNPYIQAVADALLAKGFCARFDGEEMVVKNTNAFSDHYDILTGDDFIRRGQGAYRTSCYPAAF